MIRKPLMQASFVIGERILLLLPQIVTIVLIGRVLGRDFFGEYSLVWTWAVLFQNAANFGLTESLAREIGREPENASLYFTHGLVLATAFSGVAAVVMGGVIWAMQYPTAIAIAIALAAGTLLPAALIGVCRGLLLAERKVEYITGVAAAEALIVLPLNVYWITSRAGLLPMIATLVLGKLVAACLSLGLVHFRVRAIRLEFEGGVFGRLWRTNLPFGIAMQAPALRFDVFLLSKMASMGTLGLYSAAAKIADFLLVFPLAFYLTVLPQASGVLARDGQEKTRKLATSLAPYFALLVPLGIGIFAFASPIIDLVYGTDFVEAKPILRIQMIFFLLTVFDVAVMMICRAAGFQKRDLGFVAIGRVANLGLNLLLIPSWGAIGAAIAAATTVLVLLLLRWRLVARSIVRLPWHRFVVAPLVISGVLVTGFAPLAGRVPVVLLTLAFAAAYLAIAVAFLPAFRNVRNSLAGRLRG